MIDDPYTYDISEFATQFIWGMIFWNGAEQSAQQILSELLGGGVASLALVVDMKNISVLNGIEAAGRELEDEMVRGHLAHFSKGYRALLGYRNLYVHNLRGVTLGETVGMNRKLSGFVIQTKSEGRLKSVTKAVSLADMAAFSQNAKALSLYSTAILHALGVEDYGISEALGMPKPSLNKPDWPAALQNTPSYLQD